MKTNRHCGGIKLNLTSLLMVAVVSLCFMGSRFVSAPLVIGQSADSLLVSQRAEWKKTFRISVSEPSAEKIGSKSSASSEHTLEDLLESKWRAYRALATST